MFITWKILFAVKKSSKKTRKKYALMSKQSLVGLASMKFSLKQLKNVKLIYNMKNNILQNVTCIVEPLDDCKEK